MLTAQFFVSVLVAIAVMLGTVIFIKYYFKESNLKHVYLYATFIVILMVSSCVINYLCEGKSFKALYNMIGIFFTIDYDVDNLQGVLEPIYYLVKLLAICATFYLVFARFFDILKKEDEVNKYKKNINDYVICFLDESSKKYIASHSSQKMIDANDLGENCYDGDKYFIAYSNDQKNISFYSSNKERLEGKQVSIMLNNIESSLFNEDGYSVLNLNESVAKDFWMNCAKLESFVKPKEEIIICLVGLDVVGRNILKYGLLNNIYEVEQQIIYKVWGEKEIYDTLDISINKTSQDKIYYMGTMLESITDDSIKEMNESFMCVISQWNDLIIQEIVSRTYLCKKLWIYDKDEMLGNVSSLFVNDAYSYDKNYKRKIEFFGKINIDEEMLFNSGIIDQAKKINAFYFDDNDDNKEVLWKSADIYSRKSSIACAQYNIIRKKYLEKKTFEEMKELEHMRWCRFMLLDDWQTGRLKCGDKRKEKKLHGDLIPYSLLTDKEKENDAKILRYLGVKG